MERVYIVIIRMFTTQDGDCHEVVAEAVMVTTRSKGLVKILCYIWW